MPEKNDEITAEQIAKWLPGTFPGDMAIEPTEITEEGHEFVRRATEGGFKQAVRDRDEPFGDFGLGGTGVE